MNAHSTSKNKYFDNTKNHTIFTPPPLCKWLAELLKDEVSTGGTVFDPSVGSGNLLSPFDNVTKIGCDIFNFNAELDGFIQEDFLDWKKGDYPAPDLTLANPPFNHSVESRAKWGRSTLMPELFATHMFRIFGNKAKLVLFTPMGLRLNTRCSTTKQGDRYRTIRNLWGPITSIISLPLDIFPNPDFDPEKPVAIRNPGKGIMKSNIKRKETQQEILLFNMPNLKPHYCVPDWVIEELRVMDREAWSDVSREKEG